MSQTAMRVVRRIPSEALFTTGQYRKPQMVVAAYAYEAVSCITTLLRKYLLFDMVVAGVLPENTPSIKLLE